MPTSAQHWEVFSNLFYLLPAAVAAVNAHRERGAMRGHVRATAVAAVGWCTRALGYCTLAALSGSHHWCSRECLGRDEDGLRAADHVASVWAAAATLLLAVPFEATPTDVAVDALLQAAAVGGAVAAVKLDHVARDRVGAWETIVALGTLGLGALWARLTHNASTAREVVRQLCGCPRWVPVLGGALTAAALLLWALPQSQEPEYHGAWHATSAVVLAGVAWVERQRWHSQYNPA
jgi:hypothetical protein